MSKINWKVRVQKKSFWMAIVSAVAIFVNSLAQAFGLDYSTQVQSAVDGATGLLAVLAGIGVIDDMTTKGIGDSGIAQTYTKPRDSKDPNQFVKWESESDKKEAEYPHAITPQEYDTTQPFSDDKDEVEPDYSTGGGSIEDVPESELDKSTGKQIVEESDVNEDTSSNK